MDANQSRKLDEVHSEITKRLANRVDYAFLGMPVPNPRQSDTVLGFSDSADARSFEARQIAVQARDEVRALSKKVDEVLTLLRAKK